MSYFVCIFSLKNIFDLSSRRIGCYHICKQGLSDIQKQQLGAYLDAVTEVHSALASEAYVHGVVEGIALREKVTAK